ncbi:ribonuclease P [Malassezia vespertilionis]|uniref:ribonuclease P n=1 Tax=Malassezia vespertilionis TaxID=2020962 RepID=UPI0024B040EB|nr:ribonuclease P [Malassezia vespertilionis]WFD06479.1 ribonuclease P [Malassezia vespertilionis]
MTKRAQDERHGTPDAKRARFEGTGPDVDASAVAPSALISTQLDLDAAIAARKEEILALHRAMVHARESTNMRAWQLLPRHLRRRAASHNPLRLPKRLRAKGHSELRASNTAPKTRSQVRRRAPERTLCGFIRRRASLIHRASKHTRVWLETHLWHAKRFRMSGDKQAQDGGEGRFGYCLAEMPHLKKFRASWRSAAEYATLHDASYYTVFRLTACASARHPMEAVRRMQLWLYLAGAAHGWESSWTCGTRLCETMLLARARGRNRARATSLFLAPVAPIQLLWVHTKNAQTCFVLVHPAGTHALHTSLQQGLDAVDAEQKRPRHTPPIPQRWSRQVQLRLELLPSASPAIAAGMHTAPRASIPVRSKGGFNIFRLVGKDAGRILGGVLRAAPQQLPEGGEATARVRVLDHITGKASFTPPAAIPTNMALSLRVQDPRLHFPPRNVRAEASDGEALQHLVLVRNNGTPKYTDARFFSYHALPRHSKGALDARRAQQSVPGRLEPAPDDDTVPVLILQCTIRGAKSNADLHGYTLLVPRGWGMIFWQSLVYTGATVLGQGQVRQQMLMLGRPSFPEDWITSQAYAHLEDAAEAQRRAAWERRPPAKRVAFHDAAFYPFGGMQMWASYLRNASEHAALPMHLVPPCNAAAWTRLCTALARKPADEDAPHSTSLWSRAKYEEAVLRAQLRPHHTIIGSSVVMVLLTASKRGAFRELATLHIPTLNDTIQWRTALDPPTREKDAARQALDHLEHAAAARRLQA